MISDLKRILDQISRDKGIEKHLLVEAIEEAVRSAAKKKYGSRRDMEVQYNDELGEVEVFQFRNVVEEVEDEQTEVSLKEAVQLDPEVKLHDELGTKMEKIAELGRIAAQSAKQVIIQKMKDAELDVIYDMYKDRQGDVVNGIVQRFERGNMIVNLGRTDAILPHSEQIPKRSYRQGDRIRALLLEVRQASREHQLVLSRTSNDFLAKLFDLEVPEIAEDIVRIVSVSREPGFRAKIAVASSESDVDPVGACVGMKGSRVQNVVQELQGERIDIVPWSPDPAKYVSNAMAPSLVSMVEVDEDHKTLLVVVPDDQLSLAIGRQGQNVRLASKLLNWRIDVKSEQRYAKLKEDGYLSLIEIKGIDENLADKLFDNGLTSAADVAQTTVEELAELAGVEVEVAEQLILLAASVPPVQSSETDESETDESESVETESAQQQDDASEESQSVNSNVKMRVHELAKEMSLPSKELVEKLVGLGYEVKSHSSTLDMESVEAIRKQLAAE